MERSHTKLFVLLNIILHLQKVTTFSFAPLRTCSVTKLTEGSTIHMCNGDWEMNTNDSLTEDFEIVKVELNWKFKANLEPCLQINFCTHSPDTSANYAINVLNNRFITPVFRGNYETQNYGNDTKINKTHTVELACSTLINVGEVFTVSVSVGNASKSAKIVVPGCDHPSMKLTLQCKAILRRQIEFDLKQIGESTVIAILSKSTYNKSFNKLIHFGIKQRDSSHWLGWGPLRNYQKLMEPELKAIFTDLKPGIKYTVVAWRSGENKRYAKQIVLQNLKSKRLRNVIFKHA